MLVGSFINEYRHHLWHGHISVTTTDVHNSKNFNYVMKVDTRVAGPWKDEEFDLKEMPILTRQLAKFQTLQLRRWQHQLMEEIQGVDDRRIILVHDRVGNSGKSIFTEYLEYRGLAYEVPPFTNVADLMAVVLASRQKECFVIDMPRSLPKGQLAEFYAGVESIKNGLAYDKRYAFKKQRFNRPQVVIFANRTANLRCVLKKCLFFTIAEGVWDSGSVWISDHFLGRT